MSETDNPLPSDHLHRSAANRILGGVAGGLGEYFGIDPTIVRILFILLVLFHGSGLLVYILLWIIMPGPESSGVITSDTMRESVQEFGQTAGQYAKRLGEYDYRRWWGVALLVLGAWLLLGSLGFSISSAVFQLWPLLLIGFGLFILVRR